MKISKHALTRIQQRGFQKDFINLILKYGTPIKKPGETLEIIIRKKDKTMIIQNLKRLITHIDKCANKTILVDSNMEKIITTYNLL